MFNLMCLCELVLRSRTLMTMNHLETIAQNLRQTQTPIFELIQFFNVNNNNNISAIQLLPCHSISKKLFLCKIKLCM